MATEIAGSNRRAPRAAHTRGEPGRRSRVTPDLGTRTVAAVDLGSNSFHMVVARLVQDELSIVDRLRERVALRSGLDQERRLTPKIRDRALSCLERFGQRLSGMHPDTIRAVGTNTLREARDARTFLKEAGERLGRPIEIISGAEEARLIYLGVAHGQSDDEGRRLVVDIGGGSTECIVGERFEPMRTDSLRMGCVTYSMRHFPEGVLDARSMDAAQLDACVELESIERRYKKLGWESCIGSSGTVTAIESILRENGWGETITPKGLKKLRKALLTAGHIDRLQLPALTPDRVPVIAGGLAILSAVVDSFGIESMRTSSGALREGVMYDLLGRIRHEDVRDRTIRSFSERYDVDVEQAQRVERTALELARQVTDAWLQPSALQPLSWAARLHEVGLTVAYSRFQKHGAYLVENSELAGFSRQDQEIVAALIEGHRRKLDPELFASLPSSIAKSTLRACVVLRLAARLHRSRSRKPLPDARLEARKNRLELAFPAGWLDGHALTRADLEREAEFLKASGFELTVR